MHSTALKLGIVGTVLLAWVVNLEQVLLPVACNLRLARRCRTEEKTFHSTALYRYLHLVQEVFLAQGMKPEQVFLPGGHNLVRALPGIYALAHRWRARQPVNPVGPVSVPPP